MNSRWATVVAASLVAFASLVIAWQVRHYDGGENGPYASPVRSFVRGEQLAGISNIVDRSREYHDAAGTGWYWDLVLPKDARVFMTDMTGPTNYDKIGGYFYATYYLFPREVGVSVDQPTRIAYNGFLGRTSESNQEILAHGFDVRFDNPSGEQQGSVTPLRELALRSPTNPAGFNSNYDTALAFLLPLFTALAGMWLFRFLFPTLSGQMPLLEQLAYSLGLGMMAVAALTLGVKLCGFHGRGLILMVTAVGAIAEIGRDRKIFLAKIADGYWKMVKSPIAIAILVTGSLVFLILFRLAGLQGLVDGDAMRWMLKAKIMYLCTGNELVQWFSNPRLAHAHLDYPTLVPSLHAAMYDSLGHMDEFITKFWPAWMLLFLLVALASLTRAVNHWRHVSSFVLLGLLLLPATQMYVQWEGSTMPMIFFTVMGFVNCALWLMGKDHARLGLGLTFLFGAAMTKFEGFIFLALVGSWILLLPSARPPLKQLLRFWRSVTFCLLATLPFVCLRLQIPTLNYESSWVGQVLHHPTALFSTLLNWARLFQIELARLFVNPDLANWNGEEGQLHWIGKWDGLSSLYNHTTLGMAWLCLSMTIALWFAVPTRRQVIIWTLAMFLGTTAALCGVFASFSSVYGLSETINLTKEQAGGRYLLPMLLAWFATMMTVFFADPPSATIADRSLPVLKNHYGLAVGAILIIVLGVFVLPENESSLPENLLQNAPAITPLNGFESNSPENPELQTRIELANQLDRDGKYAEALQEYHETIHLYPNSPAALNNVAWRLAASPRQELRNGKVAVLLASKAVELTGQQEPVFMGTLAAAYAEDGQFAKAIDMAKKARTIALWTHNTGVAALNEQLLKQYSAGKAVGLTNGP